MSLFDIIKYPISDPPTEYELSALPRSLYAKWLKCTFWQHRSSPTIVSSYYHDLYFLSSSSYADGFYKKDIPALRKMIKEYDDI